MFEQLEMAPADPILGLSDAFKKDGNPNKINLGVGVYKSSDGTTPTLNSVLKAEQKLLENPVAKAYLPIPGDHEYGRAVQQLMFGMGTCHEIIESGAAMTAHTPGGTGALRVAADFIHQKFPNSHVWFSDPTWANHPAIFAAAGVPVKKYPWYNAETRSLDFEILISALEQIPAGDIILLHGCCHNPSGMDPDMEQWRKIHEIVTQKGILPFFDFAYQGFATGLEEDAAGLRLFITPGQEILIASSFSKNFGLYCERVGAFTLIGKNAEEAKIAFSHVKKVVRSNYSNPPAHGAAIVTTILQDAELTEEWQHELAEMRNRINGIRGLLQKKLKEKGVEGDFSFITNQKGMFSFSGLNKAQVQRLIDEYSIYIVGSGRINVAGITEKNIDYLCESIKSVS